MEIHQILPDIVLGDAISNEALEIRDTLRSWGFKSNIYAIRVHPTMKTHAITYRNYCSKSSEKNILIYHYSIGSSLSSFVPKLPDKKILIYHNITPPEYFLGLNDELVALLEFGKEELKALNSKIDLALGDSEYNRKELIDLGFKQTGILPILINFNNYNISPDKDILRKFKDTCTNYIFVGRIAPNKRQDDIIKVFSYIYNYIDSNSRLFLIGSCNGTERYYECLKESVKQLGLDSNVYITGHLKFEELLAYYQLADVFISMSEHEGFCVPLLECMYFKIPILAFNSTAIPHTLGRAGILINKKNYMEIAEMASLLAADSNLRRSIIKRQDERLRDFDKSHTEELLRRYINGVYQY